MSLVYVQQVIMQVKPSRHLRHAFGAYGRDRPKSVESMHYPSFSLPRTKRFGSLAAMDYSLRERVRGRLIAAIASYPRILNRDKPHHLAHVDGDTWQIRLPFAFTNRFAFISAFAVGGCAQVAGRSRGGGLR